MSTETVSSAGHNTSPVPGCTMCEQVFDPDRRVVYDTEHFVGYVTPVYPWAVMLTTRRHDCDGPWALTEAEAVDLGKMIPRLTEAIRKTGSERAYVVALGEEGPTGHFHVGFLSRYVPMSEAMHDVMYQRVEDDTADPAQVATDFAAAVRENVLTPQEHHRETELATIARYEATNGEDVGEGWLKGLPLVILTTRGRSTGKPRKVVLVRCVHDGVYAVVGSGPDPIGGSPRHSQWYLNLVNDPRVTVRDGAETFEAMARTATPEEKAEWWPRVTAIWPDYDKYQANTTKDIPVVLLERTSASAG